MLHLRAERALAVAEAGVGNGDGLLSAITLGMYECRSKSVLDGTYWHNREGEWGNSSCVHVVREHT